MYNIQIRVFIESRMDESEEEIEKKIGRKEYRHKTTSNQGKSIIVSESSMT
jgi:hypothetical protein